MHDGSRLINYLVLGKRDPVAHIHVIVIIRVEAADFPQNGVSRRHVSANEMREWCAGQWHTSIGATVNPVELMRKPSGALHFKYWQWRTAHGPYAFVVVRSDQSLKPVRSCGSVIIKECEHLSTRELDRSIPGRAKAAVVFIRQDDDRYRACWVLCPEVFFSPLQ